MRDTRFGLGHGWFTDQVICTAFGWITLNDENEFYCAWLDTSHAWDTVFSRFLDVDPG